MRKNNDFQNFNLPQGRTSALVPGLIFFNLGQKIYPENYLIGKPPFCGDQLPERCTMPGI